MMKLATITLFLLTVLLHARFGWAGECTDNQAKLRAKFEAISRYNGTAPMPTMPTMDDPDRRRSGAGTEAPTNCYLLNGTALDINCDSHKCIGIILDLVEEFDALAEECPPSEFPVEEGFERLVEGLRTLPGCNRCVVYYTKFTKVEDRMKATSCYPSVSHYKCNEECSFDLERYSLLWEEMLGGICRMYNPGGCGDMGGLTEGDIYDLLNSMGNEISRIETATALCTHGCQEPLQAWYQQWKPLVAKGCISSEDVDLSKNTTTMEIFNLDLQCDGDCRTEVDEVVKAYFKTPSFCRKGLIPTHSSELTNSINFDRCRDDSGEASLSVVVIARAFFTLCLLSVGVFFIYVFSSMAYNRCVKGKKGWESVPPLFCCRSCFGGRPSSSSTHKRRSRNPKDEEEVVLYDADDIDDDGL